MSQALFLTDRRRLLAGLAATPLLTGFAAPAPVLGRVLAMSDLHSAYERTGQLLAALAAEVAAHKVPHVIAVDGDVFEHGNVAAVRSNGEIDWAFLAALPKIAPTVVNIGNHDTDLTTDLAEVVARLRGLGVTVVSNIVDARTGAPYAPAQADLPLGKRTLRVVGIATNSINTYVAASRPSLQIPVPGEWARANLAPALAGADLVMVMSHAGVAPDREILPLLPNGALMVGGHNHLQFQHRQGASLYVHTGSWSNAYTAVPLRAAGPGDAVSVPVALDGPLAPALADLIPTVLARSLTDEVRAILGTSPAALTLGDTGRAVAAA
ncbi:MAG TPA: metallophosphoesterase, partial [Phenylobacterium sp.]|nr:metallophosphoesterase [Phenylobacterium sp.]